MAVGGPPPSSSPSSGANTDRRSSASRASDEVVAAESMAAADFLALTEQEQRVAAMRLRVLARVEPLHKQRLVELLQEAGEVRRRAHLLPPRRPAAHRCFRRPPQPWPQH